jgi:hypothetical protein
VLVKEKKFLKRTGSEITEQSEFPFDARANRDSIAQIVDQVPAYTSAGAPRNFILLIDTTIKASLLVREKKSFHRGE